MNKGDSGDEGTLALGQDERFWLRLIAFVVFFPFSLIYVCVVWVIRKRKEITRSRLERPNL